MTRRSSIHLQNPKALGKSQKDLAAYLSLTGQAFQDEAPAQIPDAWPEFASSIQIRSGLTFTPFNPFYYQENIIAELTQRSAVITKGRQLGASIVIINWILWRVLREGVVALATSRTQEDAWELSKKVRSQVTYLPAEWGVHLERDSLSELSFNNGGRLVFRAPTDDLGRSLDSVAIGFIDEAQSLANLDTLQGSMTATQEACGENARMIICGTPPEHRFHPFWLRLNEKNGDRNFDEICSRMREGALDPYQSWIDEDGWAKIVFLFKAHPSYCHLDFETYISGVIKAKKITRSMALREYGLLVPEDSDVAIFPLAIVAACEVDMPVVRRSPDGAETWFEEPDPSGVYYAGCDCNGGSMTSTSAAAMIILRKLDGDRFRPAYVYRKKSGTSSLHISRWAARMNEFKPLAGAVETNMTGWTWLEQLQALVTSIPLEGSKTTDGTRPGLITRLVLAFERRDIEIPKGGILSQEALNFVSIDGKPQHAPGATDDVILATCHCLSAALYGLNRSDLFSNAQANDAFMEQFLAND